MTFDDLTSIQLLIRHANHINLIRGSKARFECAQYSSLHLTSWHTILSRKVKQESKTMLSPSKYFESSILSSTLEIILQQGHGSIGGNLQSWTKLCLKQQDQDPSNDSMFWTLVTGTHLRSLPYLPTIGNSLCQKSPSMVLACRESTKIQAKPSRSVSQHFFDEFFESSSGRVL